MQYEYRRSRILLLFVTGLVAAVSQAQVIPTGAMRRTMWEGQLAGLIAMDTIAKPGVYGIGPLEYLQGEITVVDGRCFVSRVGSDGAVLVEERSDVKAPFFVRAEASSWTAVPLSEAVVDMRSLDRFLSEWAKGREEPFLFRLRGLVGADVDYHVMNVPSGTAINGPDEAHAHQVKYVDHGNEGTLVGFFSTKHHGVFVHHDLNTHVHYLSWDHAHMGHVDALRIERSKVMLEVAE